MTPPMFVVYLTCLFLWKMAEMNNSKERTTVHQERRFISADVGDTLTLQCSLEDDAAKYYWYKQTLEQKLQLISVAYRFDKKGTFHGEFKDNRFSQNTEPGKSYLIISNLQTSDTGTYFCASGLSFVFEFGDGTRVSVKNSGTHIKASIDQSASETVQPGGSVTLNCTVHSGSCDGEHSVYWFKDSEKSYPKMIYTHGGGGDQCVRKNNTQTITCVYNLLMKSLNRSHAGIYYCAVASCGHILFGNGTKLNFEGEVKPHVLVHVLSGTLAFTIILCVSLSFLLYKINKGNGSHSKECQGRFSAPSTTNAEGYQDGDHLHYAALNVNLPNRSGRKRDNTDTECVYSSVKQ
ncbi:V-set and immunoglobulin domain-containing protein 1-like [Mugil cephalus]|uniref:V-set and immunoglobulin domain-containing protein 1-like n=1 Tax=Mugil cephalus TaxID=48193 RepID=UPI001FB84108|nr:V-set and immunoglobulin domain-containing protein 1-like [Mugil cephalus]